MDIALSVAGMGINSHGIVECMHGIRNNLAMDLAYIALGGRLEVVWW